VEGQFLVYRRIEPETVDQETDFTKRRRLMSSDAVSVTSSLDTGDGDSQESFEDKRDLELRRVVSETALGKRDTRGMMREDGLCKKTFAISIEGRVSHVVKTINSRFATIQSKM
jgi:hypothetical protein